MSGESTLEPVRCPGCGAEIRELAVYCWLCGQPLLGPRDNVGYDRHMRRGLTFGAGLLVAGLAAPVALVIFLAASGLLVPVCVFIALWIICSQMTPPSQGKVRR